MKRYLVFYVRERAHSDLAVRRSPARQTRCKGELDERGVGVCAFVRLDSVI